MTSKDYFDNNNDAAVCLPLTVSVEENSVVGKASSALRNRPGSLELKQKKAASSSTSQASSSDEVSSPMSAKTANSSLVTIVEEAFGRSFLNHNNGMNRGDITVVIRCRNDPAGPASCFQYADPIVFGIISEKNKTASVKMIEAVVSIVSPQIDATSAPTPAAPIV